jgi:photosystem II stability/assembly factor-like uncharacterized protein
MRILLALLPAAMAWAQPFDRLEWRLIGPANMGGRITDVEGVPGNPNIVYAGTGGGGLWKSVNGGMTWTPIFERQGSYSIGDLALEPGNPEVVWVGTGEANPRNSVSFGDGVYKSTDGGKSWTHMGLKDTRHISRVLIHSQNPNVIFVGALGHIFGPHAERGVFRSADGGRTWTKTLYVDDRHGVADMDIDPSNPNILYAAMWEFERKPWMHRSGSEKGGVFRSVDGGLTWRKITGGLPKLMGRIGVKVASSRPQVVYVVAETKEGTLFRSDDKGDTFRTISRDRGIPNRGFYYADLRVDPADENRIYTLTSSLRVSVDGGRSFRSLATTPSSIQRIHGDYHAMWIDPKNPDRVWVGQDGGLGVSLDRGANFEAVLGMALGQYYQIHADNRAPFYHVTGGLQDNGTWSGPVRTRDPAGIAGDDWLKVGGGDGFFAASHPDDPDWMLVESQGGSLVRMHVRSGESQSVRPVARGGGGPAAMQKYRFNWNTPIVPSSHEKSTVYVGANVLFRSTDFGGTWRALSPDLTRNEAEKQKDAGGPVFHENTTAEYHGTIISVSESTVRPGTIWVGTDDGNLQRTTDGERWTNLTGNLPVPSHSPVSHVEASRTSADTAYVAFDRHMFDDDGAYIYRTTDGGKTFTSLSAGLPPGAYVHVVRDDPKNPRLLYAGTETGLFVSFDQGSAWQRLHLKNLPHVAVHDILVHPRENDLILGTHGRSVVILDDIAFVQNWTEASAQDVHLFEPRPAWRFSQRGMKGYYGVKAYVGPNPSYGALLTYYLKQDAKDLKIEILDAGGKVIRFLQNPPYSAGVHRVAWDLRAEGASRDGEQDEETPAFLRPRGPQVPPGAYRARLTAGGRTQERPLEVKLDPALKATPSELARLYETALKLREMQTRTLALRRSLDSMREQAAGIEKTMKDRVPDAAKSIAAVIKESRESLDRLRGLLARESDVTRPAAPAGLSSQITGLLGAIDSSNAAPTAAQMAALAEIESEYRKVTGQIEESLNAQLPKWNQALGKAGAPVLVR